MEKNEITFSRNQIKRIGKKIKAKDELNNEEEQILSEWLNRHFKIMEQMRMHLSARIKQAGIQDFILAKRTKRLDSIQYKLERYPHLQLDNIQDIAGMRIICFSLADARKLINNMQKHYKKNNRVFEFTGKIDNYIESPKKDGYRSCHLILKHKETGYFLEIQIRTKIQHLWATAVEILDMQNISKIKQGKGNNIHKEFFKLCSVIFAKVEQTMVLDEFKENDYSTVCYFLNKLDKKHQIMGTLAGLAIANNHIIQSGKKEYFFFVVALDIVKKEIKVSPFYQNELEKARTEYNRLEKQENLNAVLISLDDCNSIKDAYPNYYLDSGEFIHRIKTEIGEHQNGWIKNIVNFFRWRKWYRGIQREA